MNKLFIFTGIICSAFLLVVFVDAGIQDTPQFEQPFLITSAGQSAEVQLASVLSKRAGLSYSLVKTATVQDLAGVKTIALVIGASLKGLGAAGLDMAQEKDRVSALIKSARQKNIPILCLHLGGEQRRGIQSDELISAFLPSAKLVIVVKSGNKDGLFNNICRDNGIPLVQVERTVDALEPLKNAFK
ncbi:MAG: DUF6305 family protein [Candidatus Aminicenantes bacterium]|jgi:hypothetical protein